MAMRSTNMAIGLRPPLLGKAPVATFFIPPFFGFKGSTFIEKNNISQIIVVSVTITMSVRIKQLKHVDNIIIIVANRF